MTVTDLRALTRKELAARAKRHQVIGWHEMTKEELIQILVRRLRSRKSKSSVGNGRTKLSVSNGRRTNLPAETARSNGSSSRKGRRNGTNGHSVHSNGVSKHNGTNKHNGEPTRAVTIAGAVRRLLKPTVIEPNDQGAACKDRLTGRPHDAYWIYVQWTLTQRVMERAAAALGTDWHLAVPVLRLYDVTASDTATCSKTWIRDVEIHGEIDHWYVPVENPPRAYRLHIGYRTPGGRFYALAQSNRVTMPRPGSAGEHRGAGSNDGADHGNNGAPRKFHDLRTALLSRSLDLDADGAPMNGDQSIAADFPFELETELIVHGSTHPGAEITLLGDRVPVRKDGTFSLRFSLPNGRQVIPAVAIHPHGAEQRTIVLGIERNTKELERQPLDETSP